MGNSLVIGIDPGGNGATAVAAVQAGRITSVSIINAGRGYTSAPRVTMAQILPTFDEQVIAILADFGTEADWLKAVDTLRAMALFADGPWIEVAGHCHGLLYRAEGCREEAVWDNPLPESDWIIWRAYENCFYKGDRGALLAGAGIPIDGEGP